jgi:hypothetical protein
MLPRILTFAACIGLLIAPSLAHAQPNAPAPELAPALYEVGNLRIAVRCAESFETPDRGLRVSLDGSAQPLPAVGTNGANWFGTDAHGHLIGGWVATDVGYVAPAGPHRVRIEAPDCVPEERDVVLSAFHPEHIDGRLSVASPMLEGPAGAPDGLGLVLGGFTAPYPESLRSGVSTMGISPTAYSIDPTSTQGVWLSTSYEHRYFALGLDLTFGAGQVAGTVRSLPGAPLVTPIATGPLPFSGTVFDNGLALRIGARLPLRYATLAAGSGIGGSLWMMTQAKVDGSGATGGVVVADAPQGLNATWDVPLWTSVTLKPFCGFGMQALASYEAEPSNSWHGGVTLGAGLLIQPSASCTENPGIDVKP